MIKKDLNGKTPRHGKNCFFADNAAIIGDVTMGDNCSIWYGAVLRGDVTYIKIGDNTNVQDNATIHGTYQKYPVNIGSNVTIGHNAVVHACTIEDNVLIGMGAVVLDNSVVKKNSIVAAGSVVTSGTIVEENSIYAGIPAKKIKTLSPEQIQTMITQNGQQYISYMDWYR